MPKYNNRYEYTVNRTVDNQEKEDRWLSELEQRLTKSAVQPKRVDQSMFDQINSIIGGNSKFKSVQDAVDEMQRRSGYLDYLHKKTAQDEEQKKSQSDKKNIELFNQHPEIEMTFKNYIESTSGNQDVPSIIHHVKAIHQHDVADDSLWDNDDVITYVHNLNQSTQDKKPSEPSHNLGRIDLNTGKQNVDLANDDMWAGLMPAVKNQ